MSVQKGKYICCLGKAPDATGASTFHVSTTLQTALEANCSTSLDATESVLGTVSTWLL
jgi:hypothetical protein